MVERYNTAARAGTAAQTAEYDEGLRAYMLKVYNYMASGVLLTGIVALVLSRSPDLLSIFYNLVDLGGGRVGIQGMTGLGWVAMLSPFAFILVMNFGINKLSAGALQGIFWAFATCFGISLTTVLFRYTGESVAQTFFITAASFAALSLYGYTTKRSLSGFGTFLMMGLFGLIIAMVVNFFMQSSMLQFIISVGGVLVFAGLTAYDTQRIKESYAMMATGEAVAKGAIMGAVNLYLDFVNLFMFLLHFLGNRE
jgi:FtsH-binding integral membrane protein